MTFEYARSVADAVLFGGNPMHPYRASALENRMRWQVGVVAPPGSGEPSFARTECLVASTGTPTLEVRVRFLQLRSRTKGTPCDEGVVREVDLRVERFGSELAIPFAFPGSECEERDTIWRTWSLHGVIRFGSEALPHGLHRVRITVENESPSQEGCGGGHDGMLRRSLISVHAMLAVDGGELLSALDPPERARAAAGVCRSEHTWPVLVGEPGRFVLSAPIVLPDFPQVAEHRRGLLDDGDDRIPAPRPTPRAGRGATAG